MYTDKSRAEESEPHGAGCFGTLEPEQLEIKTRGRSRLNKIGSICAVFTLVVVEKKNILPNLNISLNPENVNAPGRTYSTIYMQ